MSAEPSTSIDVHQVTPAGDVLALTHDPLDCMAITNSVGDDGAGAIATFIGTTRDSFEGGQSTMSARGSELMAVSPGKRVTRLTYEAYSALCIRTFASIVSRARALSSCTNAHALPSSSAPAPSPTDPSPSTLKRIALHHRLGEVPVGQASIIIAVSSPHRREAFRACEWILEEVKREAQVWKREWYADEGAGGKEEGSTWKSNAPVA